MKAIFIFFVFCLIAGLAVVLFFFIGKSINTEEAPTTRSMLIKAVDFYTDEQIAVPFVAIINDTIIARATTRNDSLITINVPITGELIEFYVQDPGYYTDMKAVVGGTDYTIVAMPVSNISLSYYGNITGKQGDINVSIQTEGITREVSFCVRWSRNIIEVEAPFPTIMKINDKLSCEDSGYTWNPEVVECETIACKLGWKEAKITPANCSVSQYTPLPPSRLERIDRCFLSKKTIMKEDPLDFTLSYRGYETDGQDYIEVIVMDSNKNLQGHYVIEGEQGEDVGIPDKAFMIR